MIYKTTDSLDLKLKKGRQVSASSKLLQTSISGMPVVEASLTLSFLFQYQC